ncbi:hypothetical protein FACS1894172_21100 [Spirochaetia bacterium]|nr:hypothetical protein FACS1894172_21100 [Spirochaetia bacterium]
MIIPYANHSFNQFILPLTSEFLFTDHGDAYPRSVSFARFQQDSDTKRLHTFALDGSSGQSGTFVEMGRLIKTSSGSIVTGSYGQNVNNPRNLFIIRFDNNLTSCSQPLYLMNYTGEAGHTTHPKITTLNMECYFLLLEKYVFTNQNPNSWSSAKTDYLLTYMLIIDEQGKHLSQVQELSCIRLNMNDTLHYNRQTKKVYWSINNGRQSILSFALDPTAYITLNAAAVEVAPAPAEFEFSIQGTDNSCYVKINKYIGTKPTLIIPETINRLSVTTIGEKAFAFAGISKITLSTDIIIPAGVSRIGAQVFSYYPKLTIVIISGTISLDLFTFSDCPDLQSVSIPQMVTDVGYVAFSECTGLNASTRAELQRRFGDRAFQ